MSVEFHAGDPHSIQKQIQMIVEQLRKLPDTKVIRLPHQARAARWTDCCDRCFDPFYSLGVGPQPFTSPK